VGSYKDKNRGNSNFTGSDQKASSPVTSFQTNSPEAAVGFVKMHTGQLVKKPLKRGLGLRVRMFIS
jgi:hypothetical protein